ncbi:LamG-like jellyroll fold domain-containing protein [Flavobacterium sp.]|uniref:LamG-like jellyroll fold domain-containing protein n=5 Tax=Flavobacterium sp. TaxID=239 RepID=UPI004048A95C
MKTKLLILLLLAFSMSNAQTISTRVGSTPGYVEGTSATARFDRPKGIAIDGGAAVVVTDQNNNRVRKVFSDHSTAFWAGSATGGTIINGTGAAARFSSTGLEGVARDGFNNAYVCDAGNNAIRKITSAGVVTTFAGGTQGTADGTGTAAQFNYPVGIAIDASGNLYVTDASNHRIRKITPAGVVTTLAGSTNGYADGTGTAAQFSFPMGIAVDASGNVFVGENCRIRKITPAGVVTTFAGGTVGYLDGNGTAAKFNNGILGIAIDNSSNLYVADSYNYRIRKITPTGDVSTYAGLGYSGTTDGDVSVATFDVITGIAINTAQNILYIVDHFNNRIREILPPVPATVPTISGVIVSQITTSSARIFYSLNANNGATTSIVKYGLSSGALTNQITGFSTTGNTANQGYVNIYGLSPGTTYYFQIEATNTAGTATSTIGSFTTLSPPTPLTIAEYSFDNTYNNLLGSAPFASNAGTSFTTDRHGNTSGAININGTGSTATITGLPYGNEARTVSVWAKVNAHNSAFPFHNTIFSYGASSNSNAFGCSITDGSTMALGYNDNYVALSTNNLSTWDHYVCAYDGTNAKVYKNGTLLGSQAKVWNTINNSDVFRIGIGVGGEFWFNGAIDDLKIYNYVLTDTEISNLYSNNTLSSSNFSQNNLEVALYPNPVNDVLNIETVLDIQSVEIYNIQGQKVLSSNQKQINVSDLAFGMYMVRIQDVDNNIATKKIVIK